MWRNFRLIPNQVTAIRLLVTFILWGMLIFWSPQYLGIGIIICLISDILDGQLARRLHQATEFGARFDSLADNILIPSALIWLFISHPEIYTENLVLLSLAIITYLSSLIIRKVHARDFDVSQLYLSKLSGLTQYIFAIHTFVSGQYNVGLFYLTMGIFFISSLESLTLQFMKVQINEHLTSMIFTWGLLNRSKAYQFYVNFTNSAFSIVYGAHPSTPKNTKIVSS
jgi:phosphatidylglycerophosphate synthase